MVIFSYLVSMEELSEHHKINSRQFLRANGPIGLQGLIPLCVSQVYVAVSLAAQSGCVPMAPASTTEPLDMLSRLHVLAISSCMSKKPDCLN